jgi:hypothetical protein
VSDQVVVVVVDLTRIVAAVRRVYRDHVRGISVRVTVRHVTHIFARPWDEMVLP